MDAGGIIVGFVSGFLVSLLATAAFPVFNRRVTSVFSYIANSFDPDRFRSYWKNGSRHLLNQVKKIRVKGRVRQETVSLVHTRNHISGEGSTKRLPRTFFYDLQVRHHDMILGFYNKKAEKGNLPGMGLCQMIISRDRRSMTGQATWYDHHTDRIESSEIIWIKQS